LKSLILMSQFGGTVHRCILKKNIILTIIISFLSYRSGMNSKKKIHHVEEKYIK
jgi:hypothetical protein